MNQSLATVQYKPTELTTERLGEVLVKSGFFQDTRDIAQAIVKVLAGRELGFGPIASMQGVYIVKGRVTLSANLVGAAIQRSGKYLYEVLELDNEKCRLRFQRRRQVGDVGPPPPDFISAFSIQDAQQAGISGDTYKKFPRNMLFARALTNGARWYCPEVFNGPIYTPDELGAVVEVDGRVVDTTTGEVLEQSYAPPREREDIEDREIEPMVTSIDDPTYQHYAALCERARPLQVEFEVLELPVPLAEVKAKGTTLQGLIKAARADLAHA